MKLIGRTIALNKLLRTGLVFFKMVSRLYIVKQPFTILKYYVQQRSPKYIELQNGTVIACSSHPHDIITFFVVFLKQEYGFIKPGSVVIDVGANIGMFSLYAALSGASKVYAFEPSKEAFDVLCENIKSNKLTDRIVPINKALSNADDETIYFPYSSSPYNSIEKKDNSPSQKMHKIQTITLNSFIGEMKEIDRIDLLKLDCEGSEFDIIPSIDVSACLKIHRIRMECHHTPVLLMEGLIHKGFRTDLIRDNTVWMSRGC